MEEEKITTLQAFVPMIIKDLIANLHQTQKPIKDHTITVGFHFDIIHSAQKKWIAKPCLHKQVQTKAC